MKQLIITTLFDDVLHCFCFVFAFLSGVPAWRLNNVSVQYKVGLLPDRILLTQCYYSRGTRLNAMKRFCLCSLSSHVNVLTFSPLTGGCS